jgi:hypothetical protein
MYSVLCTLASVLCMVLLVTLILRSTLLLLLSTYGIRYRLTGQFVLRHFVLMCVNKAALRELFYVGTPDKEINTRK